MGLAIHRIASPGRYPTSQPQPGATVTGRAPIVFGWSTTNQHRPVALQACEEVAESGLVLRQRGVVESLTVAVQGGRVVGGLPPGATGSRSG